VVLTHGVPYRDFEGFPADVVEYGVGLCSLKQRKRIITRLVIIYFSLSAILARRFPLLTVPRGEVGLIDVDAVVWQSLDLLDVDASYCVGGGVFCENVGTKGSNNPKACYFKQAFGYCA
jgi:hypothetical protein